MFALTGDQTTMRYMGFPAHKSVDEATALIAQWRNSPSRFQAVCLIEKPADILGVFGFEVRGHQAIMTIMFRRDMTARGAGREFAVPFVQWIFTHPRIWRVSAYCHVKNIPVQNLLARMGALREGCLRRLEWFPNVSTEEPQDVYVYSFVRGEEKDKEL